MDSDSRFHRIGKIERSVCDDCAFIGSIQQKSNELAFESIELFNGEIRNRTSGAFWNWFTSVFEHELYAKHRISERQSSLSGIFLNLLPVLCPSRKLLCYL